jgi:hypothetical protein
MTNYAAIVYVHRDGVLTRTVRLRRACRDSRIDCLYHDITRLDIGTLRLYLDSDPRPRWVGANIHPRCFVDITRADGHSIGCPDGPAKAEQGDVVTLRYQDRATVTFTLVELVPLESTRGDVITLLAIADEESSETRAELLRNVAERFARFPHTTY